MVLKRKLFWITTEFSTYAVIAESFEEAVNLFKSWTNNKVCISSVSRNTQATVITREDIQQLKKELKARKNETN